MGIVLWIVFGFVVGIIAKLLMPGRDPGGFVVTALIGIAGSLIGGFIGQAIGLYRGTGESLQPSGFIMSILGAVVLPFLYRVITRRNALAV